MIMIKIIIIAVKLLATFPKNQTMLKYSDINKNR